SSFTDALVTIVAGIVRGILIILPICRNLVPKTKTTIAMSRAIAITIGLRRRFGGDGIGRFKTGLATSCISKFCLRFKQQPPQSTLHLYLSSPPLRRGHFLWTQNIEHQHPACDGKN